MKEKLITALQFIAVKHFIEFNYRWCYSDIEVIL